MYLDGKVEQAFQAELASRRQRQIVAAAGVRWKFRANLPLLEQPRCHWQRKARRIVPVYFLEVASTNIRRPVARGGAWANHAGLGGGKSCRAH